MIVEDNNSRIFVEVKDVDNTQDLHNYISPKKISTILKTILFFNQRHPTEKQLRVDLVFVKQNTILHHYENITNQ
ncbi:TPA: hypothetical protein DEP21_00445 [Patescibacteria group bacterium]|nr:hypothetical protein [Candidatus Gracilibacteria bacterium]